MTHPLQGTLESSDGAWVLTLVRDFSQPAEKLWPWLTDPDRLRQWFPSFPTWPWTPSDPERYGRIRTTNQSPVTWSASTHRMSWCTGGATTWCAGDFHRQKLAAG